MKKLLLLLPLSIALSGCCVDGAYIQRQSKATKAPGKVSKAVESAIGKNSETLSSVKNGDTTQISLKGDASFARNSAELNPVAKAELSTLASALVKTDAKSIKVVGHTDSRGSAELNDALSVKRAENVKDLFVEKGVQASRIKTSGVGSSQPIATNDTAAGRAKNRRVEITVKN